MPGCRRSAAHARLASFSCADAASREWDAGCGSGNASDDRFVFGSRRRRLRVFLDAIRLSIGNLFIKDIMQAMLRSREVCPVISADATRRNHLKYILQAIPLLSCSPEAAFLRYKSAGNGAEWQRGEVNKRRRTVNRERATKPNKHKQNKQNM